MRLNLKGIIKNIGVGILNFVFLYFIANFCIVLSSLPLFVILVLIYAFLVKIFLNRLYTPKIHLYKFLFLQYTIFVSYILFGLLCAFLGDISPAKINPSHMMVAITSFCLAVVFGISWLKCQNREKLKKEGHYD